MRRHDNALLFLGLVMLSLGAAVGLFCSFLVSLTHPILGIFMGSITLTPVVTALVLWLLVIEHRRKK